MKLLGIYSKFLDIVQLLLKIVLGALLAAVVLIMFYQTIMRYIFNNSQAWCEELAVYLTVYIVMLGIGIATRRNTHLQVDFLLSFLSERANHLIVALSSCVAVVAMGFFFRYTLSVMRIAVGKSTTLPLTMREIYISCAIGAVLVILFGIELAIKEFIAFVNNKTTEKIEEGTAK